MASTYTTENNYYISYNVKDVEDLPCVAQLLPFVM